MSKNLISNNVLSIAFIMILTFLHSVGVLGQSGISSVAGIVTDELGNVIAGANVRLINDEKGFSRTTSTTNNTGVYDFVSIPPGTYTLEIEAAGFKKYVNANVAALIDKPMEVNVTLQVGNISETVAVTTDSIESVINTQDGSIGNNFQSQQITELPTDLRNVTTLLSLQPGVTREGYVNGGRSDQANFTLDGVDVNDQQSGVDLVGNNGAFNTVLRFSVEAVDEFRVTTSNPNAGQGRSSGAQVSLSTKRGTNNFRGVAFEFFRPTTGSANTFINNRAGIERENITRNIFGGALGGPIFQNRAFFFYSFEGIRQPNAETSVVQTVPLASLGQGILNLRTTNGGVLLLTQAQLNNIYTQAGLNPAALAIFAGTAQRYPANDFSSGAGDNLNTAGYRFNAPTSSMFNTHILRLDFNIKHNQTIFFRGNKQFDVISKASAFPDTPSPQIWQHNTGLAFGHSWIVGNNKVNNFRYGLTRQAFTDGGDADRNAISFALVFSPLNYTYSLSRITPVNNFTDDFTWTRNNHTLQFGGNLRLIRNKRQDLSPAFDSAVANPSFYANSGQSLLLPIINAGFNNVDPSSLLTQAAVAAMIGRFSQYTVRYNYDLEGNVLPTGTPIKRTFASEELDVYVQNSWKANRNLTLNFGLRYGLSRPVYETHGYQIRPTLPLGEFFRRRLAGMESGQPYNESLQFQLAGPKNDAPGFYGMDKNNFQPRLSAAWSPSFKSGFLSKLFGKNNISVLRGGFAVTNDYFGQQLAVTFDNLSTLGFTTSSSIGANTYNATTNLGPRFTGFGQQINNFPGVPPLTNRFQTPADETQRIESSLDSTLVAPTNYNWNFTYGRKLPKGFYVEISYIGRSARNLLVERDVAAFNNLRDSASGVDWYTAAGRIYDLFYAGANINSVQPIPYFENLFPGLGAMLPGVFGLPVQPNSTRAVYSLNQNYALGDWTLLQLFLDDDLSGGNTWSNLFIHPQYAAFSAYSTVGRSNYNGASLSIRQRLGTDLIFDLNYTFSKSMDDASGLQSSGGYGAAFILNPILQQASYGVSDFDVRHVINANAIWKLPFGKGRKFFGNLNKVADAFLGGWQLGGIYRWNTGLPFSAPVDLSGWATNWQVRSRFVRTGAISTSYFRGGNGENANIFRNINELIGALRPPRPGETGDRNVFRSSGFSVLDMNLGKTFTVPWNENHRLEFRYEVFNVFNHQYLSGINTIAINPAKPPTPLDPDGSQASIFGGSGEFTNIRGNARRMQFGLRYSF
jgi:hypothetical protein